MLTCQSAACRSRSVSRYPVAVDTTSPVFCQTGQAVWPGSSRRKQPCFQARQCDLVPVDATSPVAPSVRDVKCDLVQLTQPRTSDTHRYFTSGLCGQFCVVLVTVLPARLPTSLRASQCDLLPVGASSPVSGPCSVTCFQSAQAALSPGQAVWPASSRRKQPRLYKSQAGLFDTARLVSASLQAEQCDLVPVDATKSVSGQLHIGMT